ncbi:MAG TPA: ATP-dependent 6-phosphofructokinase [Gemmatimonadaceae bacterium]|nr:ATP-dependent 6-phosphofructokinase [Gemmatimonadaceae bacterium]
MRIAISTGGGDAPGLNAVIRAAVLSAFDRGWDVLGIKRGYAGLLGEDEVIALNRASVSGIGHLGGTILRTTNRGNPFHFPERQPDGSIVEIDRSDELIDRANELGIDAILTIGGDGSLAIAQRLYEKGVKIVAVPKTIDNDVSCTITSFGFDTAVSTAIDAIDKLHTTAESHDRVIVLEVMGRDAGFIALYSGLAGTADVILIPEIPYNIERVCDKIRSRDRAGRHFSIVVAAEGAFPIGGGKATLGDSLLGEAHRVGGIADSIAREIQKRTDKECRSLVLGHLQRGGMPTGYDRLLATRFGGAAVRAIADERWGEMVALQSPHIVCVPIAEVLKAPKRVELEHDVMLTARATGISFGD